MTTVSELASDPGLRTRESYRLDPLSKVDTARWDELTARYNGRELFHRRVWLDYLAASRGVTIRFWGIRSGHRTVGYFCGGIVRKGPFRVLGSPLKGWGTNFMGPVVDGDFDQIAFLRSLDDLAAREKFSMVELENPLLSAEALAGMGYEAIVQPTFIVPLTPGEPEKMWSRLTQRTQVRKAQKNGLTVEDTGDPEVANEFYDLFRDLMARKGLHPPYDRRCPQLLFEFLKPNDLIFALRARNAHGQTLAVGLFPHDGQTLYYWGGASAPEAAQSGVNDLLHWTVMEKAAAGGLRAYNMCGNGFFKKKFGGTLEEPKRWHKCYSGAARLGRRVYLECFHQRMRLKGWWHRVNLGR